MLETSFLQVSQWLLTPILWLLAAALAYALWMSGAVLMEAWQRRRPGFRSLGAVDRLDMDEIELLALRRIEPLRLLSRVTPMLGLIATMIPLGPALQGVANGGGSTALAVFSDAFAGVVLALTAAAIGLVLYSVRRRWLLTELLAIRKARG
jgi:biopolymer transport protein ExbB/TolQ